MQIIKQSKSMPSWIGALQVQISSSMFYMNLVSTGMMILTFWYTAGYQIRNQFAHWFNLWVFVGIVIVIFAAVMVLDFVFVLPSRQAFTNEQTCKHENPAMDALVDIQKDMAKIKARLGIE